TRLAVGPCRSFRFLDAWDPFVDQHHGEDQEQDGDDDRVVLAQRGLPAVQDRLSLLAHRERDYERSGHAERGDENVHRDGPHLLPSRQARRGDSHRRCYADDDVLWVERADAYANEQGLAGSEPSDAIHPLRHRRLLGRFGRPRNWRSAATSRSASSASCRIEAPFDDPEPADRLIVPAMAAYVRRIVDSHGTAPPIPRPARVASWVSAAHSAIAVNDRAPASTAHTASARITARITARRCRTPRRARGSATAASTDRTVARSPSRPSSAANRWQNTGSTGDDDAAGM